MQENRALGLGVRAAGVGREQRRVVGKRVQQQRAAAACPDADALPCRCYCGRRPAQRSYTIL